MKLTILGSGTCASQLPNIPNRYPPAFLVEFGEEKVLFDCSESVRFRLEQAGFNYAEIKDIAISHIHPDHFALVHFVQSVFCHSAWSQTNNKELNIYAPKQVGDSYPLLLEQQIHEINHPALKEFTKVNFHLLPGNTYTIGQGKLSGESLYHGFGLTEAIGFRLETREGIFVYSGDTGDCPGIRKVCLDADIFICEASARIGDEKAPTGYGHLNPRMAGEIARNGNVKKLVLFHNTGLDSDENIIANCRSSGFEGEIIIAKDFQTLTA